ncbi:hypothetical protein GCM10010464_20180 [Pseudonocardia yunnanensis]|uniref:Uncharacterized protein n=1 Tax=Pseudonocardia yunnanensis TaxID=58107 RepID=A0ABW4EPG4_9PSEU
MSGGLSSTEVDAARRRFEQDQDDAEYVEFTYAMERIGGGRRWRRQRRRLLRTRGLELGEPPLS